MRSVSPAGKRFLPAARLPEGSLPPFEICECLGAIFLQTRRPLGGLCKDAEGDSPNNALYATAKRNCDRPLHLVEICAATGASERTLRIVCEEHLGMGPVRLPLVATDTPGTRCTHPRRSGKNNGDRDCHPVRLLPRIVVHALFRVIASLRQGRRRHGKLPFRQALHLIYHRPR